MSHVWSLSFVVWWEMSYIRHMMSDVSCQMCDVCCLISDIWCLVSNVWCLISDVWGQTSDVWYLMLMLDFWCLMSDVWWLLSDVRCVIFVVWCQTSDISRLNFFAWCLMSNVWCRCLMFVVWCETSDVRCLMSDICGYRQRNTRIFRTLVQTGKLPSPADEQNYSVYTMKIMKHSLLMWIFILTFTPDCNNVVLEKWKKGKSQMGIN